MTVTFGTRLEEVRDRRARRKRLPKLPAEHFWCERLHAAITRAACARQWLAWNTVTRRTGLVLGMSGSSCTRCPTGADHARGVLPAVTVVAAPVPVPTAPAKPRLCLRCGGAMGRNRKRLCRSCTRQPTSYEGLAVAMEHR